MAGLEGTRLGAYHLLRRIGSGEMSEVYLAEQQGRERQVAIKVLHQTGIAAIDKKQRQILQQFLAESRLVATWKHPNIIPIYDVGEQNGVYYLVMEYMPFGSLADFLIFAPGQRYQLPLPPSLAADVIYQAAGALQFAHDHNIVHFDVKPRNLLLKVLPFVHMSSGQSGPQQPYQAPAGEIPVQLRLLIADLCLSRLVAWLSAQREMPLTPLYAAPEQFQGRPVPATDQYALAGVAYLLLTGETVFKGSPSEIRQQHVAVAPRLATAVNPQLPATVNEVLMRALAKDPMHRYARIQDFGQALQQAASTSEQRQVYSLPMSAVGSVTIPCVAPSTPSARPQSGAQPEAALAAPAQTSPRRSPVPHPVVVPANLPQPGAEVPPELHQYRKPDAPRAPLPPSAQKFATYQRLPIGRLSATIQELPLWQRLAR